MLIGCELNPASPNPLAKEPTVSLFKAAVVVIGAESRPWNVELRIAAALGGLIGNVGRK